MVLSCVADVWAGSMLCWRIKNCVSDLWQVCLYLVNICLGMWFFWRGERVDKMNFQFFKKNNLNLLLQDIIYLENMLLIIKGLVLSVTSRGSLESPHPVFRAVWFVRQTTPVFLPGKSHKQRSLVGWSPWVHKESSMTERLTLSLSEELFGDEKLSLKSWGHDFNVTRSQAFRRYSGDIWWWGEWHDNCVFSR